MLNFLVLGIGFKAMNFTRYKFNSKKFLFYKHFNKNCAFYWAYLHIQCTSRFVIYARIKSLFVFCKKNKMQTRMLLSKCKRKSNNKCKKPLLS